MRGLASADSTRDFFVTDIPTDFYNVDRVEIQRGPNSILFGLRSYNATKDVLAVVLRDVDPVPARYEVRLRNQSLIRAGELELEQNAVVIRDGTLGQFEVPLEDVLQIQRAANSAK